MYRTISLFCYTANIGRSEEGFLREQKFVCEMHEKLETYPFWA